LLQHPSVKVFVKRNNLAGAVFCLGRGTRSFAHGTERRFIAEQIDGVARHGIDIAHVGQESADAVLDHFRHAAIASRNRDHFTGHALEGGEAEGFQFAGH